MIRRLLISVAAVTLAAVALPPATAQAIPFCRDGFACRYEWYVDREHTELVGWRDIHCDGQVFTGGTQTGFLIFNQVRCNA